MLEFTSNNFDQEVLQSQVPVMVDFWASWCGPCRIQGPLIEVLSEEYKDKPVKIAKLNIEEYGDIAERYRIFSIPTIMIFVSGVPREQLIGLQSKDTLKEYLDKYIRS